MRDQSSYVGERKICCADENQIRTTRSFRLFFVIALFTREMEYDNANNVEHFEIIIRIFLRAAFQVSTYTCFLSVAIILASDLCTTMAITLGRITLYNNAQNIIIGALH